MGIMFAFLSALSFTTCNVLVKKGANAKLGENGYFLSVLINVIFLGFILLIAVGLKPLAFSWTGTGIFIISGLLTTGLGRLSFFSGIERIGPSRASVIKNGSPLFALLFSVTVLQEKLGFWPSVGILLILAGILIQGLLFQAAQKGNEPESARLLTTLTHSREKTGYLLAVLAAVSFGVGQGVRKQGLTYIDHAYYGAWAGALATLLFLLLYHGWRGQLGKLLERSKLRNPYFLVTGLFSSLGALFFFVAITYTQVSYVSVIAATEPLLTVLASAFFLKQEEQISSSIWLTAGLILCGSVLIALTM